VARTKVPEPASPFRGFKKSDLTQSERGVLKDDAARWKREVSTTG
jgi:hypothetical protein